MKALQTASDFERYYETPDPWGLSKARRRSKAIARIVKPLVQGKTVLELGCGEGMLTATLFQGAARVTGIDISQRAIARAPKLPNARFEAADMMSGYVDFSGYDVILAIEVVNYLSESERDVFFAKVADQHKGLLVLMTAIGADYFSTDELLTTLPRHGLKLTADRYAYSHRLPNAGLWGAVAVRLPGSEHLAERHPDQFVQHRCYLVECG